MTGTRSALVLTVLLGAHGSLGAFAVAAAEEAPAKPALETADQPADASLRKRAEDLARAASERFTEIIRQPKIAQNTTPQSYVAPATSETAADEAFAPVWGWLARSAKDYDDVIVAKFRNPSGDVVLLAPRGTVVAQQDVPPQVPETKPAEAPPAPAPQPAWTWDGIVERGRDWLNRAGRTYRNEIVKKLKQPEAGAAWPPAEVVPQAPSPADVAAEAEAERHADEVKRAAANAEADRQLEPEGQKLAEEMKRKQQAEAQIEADKAEAKRKADAEAKHVADEAEAKKAEERRLEDVEAKRKADAEARRLADEAEAKRKAVAEANRLADEVEAKRKAEEAEAKRKADAEAKRLADEVEVKHKADVEAKRVADEAEAKRLADEVEAKRKAEEAEAKRKADAEAKRIADAAETKRKAAEAETARRLEEEAATEHKAVAEAEAKRLAGEAAAKRAAAEGRKPAHENSSVAIALPAVRSAPADEPPAAEPERKARKEVLALAPVPKKVITKKRHVAVAYEARPKKGKHKQHIAQHKRGHKHRYVVVETRHPKDVAHAYRQKSHGPPPIPVRNTVRKAPQCACPRAYRTPASHHRHKYAVRHHHAGPRVLWRSCGDDSYFDPVPWMHHHKLRHRHLTFHRPRLYISPERR